MFYAIEFFFFTDSNNAEFSNSLSEEKFEVEIPDDQQGNWYSKVCHFSHNWWKARPNGQISYDKTNARRIKQFVFEICYIVYEVRTS